MGASAYLKAEHLMHQNATCQKIVEQLFKQVPAMFSHWVHHLTWEESNCCINTKHYHIECITFFQYSKTTALSKSIVFFGNQLLHQFFLCPESWRQVYFFRADNFLFFSWLIYHKILKGCNNNKDYWWLRCQNILFQTYFFFLHCSHNIFPDICLIFVGCEDKEIFVRVDIMEL